MRVTLRLLGVLVFLGSLVLNGLQYVGSPLIGGVLNLVHATTGVESLSSKNSRLSAERKSFVKGARARSGHRFAKAIGRSGTRLGAEFIPTIALPIALAIETKLIVSDLADLCESIDDMNDMTRLLGLDEPELNPEYCGLSSNDLMGSIMSSDDFESGKKLGDENTFLDEFGASAEAILDKWRRML